MRKNIIIIILVTLGLLALIAAYMIPANECNATPCQLNEVLPRLAAEQQAVERILSDDKKTLGRGYEIDRVSSLFSGYVTSEGKIILVLESGAVVISEFNSSSDNMDWECNIYPEKFSDLPSVIDCGKRLR